MLKHGIHAAAVGRLVVESLVSHPDFARGRGLEARDNPQQRGFARAAFAEDREKFSFRNFQRNVPQHHILAEILGDVANAEQWCAAHADRQELSLRVSEVVIISQDSCVYCAAFTSFQISLYLARRGTFCQK